MGGRGVRVCVRMMVNVEWRCEDARARGCEDGGLDVRVVEWT